MACSEHPYTPDGWILKAILRVELWQKNDEIQPEKQPCY